MRAFPLSPSSGARLMAVEAPYFVMKTDDRNPGECLQDLEQRFFDPIVVTWRVEMGDARLC